MRQSCRRSELAAAQIGANSYGYAYDSIGNRQWFSANGVTNGYAANCLNQYSSVEQSTFNIQPSYDADGNLTQDDCFYYAYDAENRMLSARPVTPVDGSLAVENHYDHRHRRARKIVRRYDGSGWQPHETHTFVWDGNNIVLERIAFADGATSTCEYFWGNDLSGTEQGAGGVGGLLAVSIDGAFFIPCYDHNGNIVCYVSETGAIAGQYVYDPYGNVIEQYGTMPNQFNFGFSTKYFDRETGMLSYQRRFYRFDLGRWLNRDPIEERGGENLYAFCVNNPVYLYDIDGLVDWQGVLMGGLQVFGGLLSAKVAALSLFGSGGMSAPAAVFLMAWSAATIANGYTQLSAGLKDRGSPEALQVSAVTKTYETIVGSPMNELGTNITYFCYYAIDIKCACYSISVTWSSMIQEGMLYRKYSEIPLTTRSGVQILKTNSSLEFLGNVPGASGAAGSVLIDYKSLFFDVYEMSDKFFNGDE